MIILETDRLILRTFEMSDLDRIYELVYADPMVKDTWSGATGTPDDLKQRFARRYIQSPGTFGLRALVRKSDNSLVGLMGFQRHEPGQGNDIYYLLSQNDPELKVGFDPDFVEVELTYALGRSF